jgi:hypothetical protein
MLTHADRIVRGRVPENIEVAHYLFRSKPESVDKFVNLVDERGQAVCGV